MVYLWRKLIKFIKQNFTLCLITKGFILSAAKKEIMQLDDQIQKGRVQLHQLKLKQLKLQNE